ncbi:hypothetical protein ACTXT7_015819 [Hymenolepis weldensis]
MVAAAFMVMAAETAFPSRHMGKSRLKTSPCIPEHSLTFTLVPKYYITPTFDQIPPSQSHPPSVLKARLLIASDPDELLERKQSTGGSGYR